jgi:hypothetical protein
VDVYIVALNVGKIALTAIDDISIDYVPFGDNHNNSSPRLELGIRVRVKS